MVSLTRGGVTYTFPEGSVETIESSINSNVEQEAMPGMLPIYALVFDFNGAIKTITINGEIINAEDNTLSSGSAISINEQRQWLEQTISGFQTGITFESNYTSSYNGSIFIDSKVLFGSIRFVETTGKPNSLPFQINLVVGDI